MNLSENCQSPKISNFKARFYLPDCHSFNSTINNRIKSAVIKNNSLTNKNIENIGCFVCKCLCILRIRTGNSYAKKINTKLLRKQIGK